MLRIAEGAIAGVAAGIVVGIAARIAMRLVAIGAADGIGQLPDFTVAGSLVIVASGAIVGAPFGVVYAHTRERLPGPARVHGLVFAALLLVFLGPLFLTNDELFSSGRLALFALLFPIYGLCLGLALPMAETLAERLPANVRRLVALAAAGSTAFVVFGFAGVAAATVERHGAVTLAFAIPWITLAVLGAPALRARIARLQAAR